MHIIDWWSQIANQKPYPTSICHFAIRSYWGPFNPVSIHTPDYILSLSWQRIASTTPTLHRWISTTLICTKGFVRSSLLFVKSTAPLIFNGHCNWFLAKYRKLELGYIRLPTAKCPYHMLIERGGFINMLFTYSIERRGEGSDGRGGLSGEQEGGRGGRCVGGEEGFAMQLEDKMFNGWSLLRVLTGKIKQRGLPAR